MGSRDSTQNAVPDCPKVGATLIAANPHKHHQKKRRSKHDMFISALLNSEAPRARPCRDLLTQGSSGESHGDKMTTSTDSLEGFCFPMPFDDEFLGEIPARDD
eukprot:Selendium_serpulae@DN1510_c0_g1_i1.p2